MSHSRFACLASLLLVALAPMPARAEVPSLPSLISQYEADQRLLGIHLALAAESEASLVQQRELLQHWSRRIADVPFTRLPHDQQVDALLLQNELKATLLQLDTRAERRAELAPWLPFQAAINSLTEARVRGEPLDPEKAASLLAPVPKAIKSAREALKATKQKKDEKKEPAPKPSAETPTTTEALPPLALPTPYQALLAAEATDALASSLKLWFNNYQGFLPDFAWWVRQPQEQTAKALTEYSKYLREEIAGFKPAAKDADGAAQKSSAADEEASEEPLLGKPIGEESLQRQLALEFIPYSPAELITIAEREFAWCEDQMRAASRELKQGDDWKKALKQVKLEHVKPGEQETFVRAEARRATDFVKERQLVTVPPQCEQWWGTRMLLLAEQRSIPYAAYTGHDMLVAFASEAMKHEDKLMSMRGNNRAFTRNVVPHEIIPGHHLQCYMAARERPYRSLFSTPFFVEGWSLYWEMRLYSLQYQATPEDRIGALFWRMHRCARIIVTLKYHLGQMEPAQMVDFLIERVVHERFGATSEVRRYVRGNYSPLYQCGYMLGGLQILALHRELVTSGKLTEQQFHDALLKLGPIPIELVRASLLQQPLSPEFKTQWRFDTP